MDKTLLQITEKYLELINNHHTCNSVNLEILFLWAYKKIPIKHTISRGQLESVETIIEGKEVFEKNVYFDSREFIGSLKDQKEYIDLLKILRFGTITVLMEDAIICIEFKDNTHIESNTIWVYSDNKEVALKYEKLVNWIDNSATRIPYNILFFSFNGELEEHCLESDKHEIDIDSNYNYDLPLPQIREFIESSTPGLMIFNGEPGT